MKFTQQLGHSKDFIQPAKATKYIRAVPAKKHIFFVLIVFGVT
jgi:hypothetical protein